MALSTMSPKRLSLLPIDSSVLGERQIANPLVETLLQVILDAFASCGRITGNPEVIHAPSGLLPKNAHGTPIRDC